MQYKKHIAFILAYYAYKGYCCYIPIDALYRGEYFAVIDCKYWDSWGMDEEDNNPEWTTEDSSNTMPSLVKHLCQTSPIL